MNPWTTEPDRVKIADHTTGMICLLVRAAAGHWCGYVSVLEDHPWWGADATDLGDVDIHGGISYAAHGGGPISYFSDGRPDRRYWVGFSCDHVGDLVPAVWERMGDLEQVMCSDVYRDMRWARLETERLALLAFDALVACR